MKVKRELCIGKSHIYYRRCQYFPSSDTIHKVSRALILSIPEIPSFSSWRSEINPNTFLLLQITNNSKLRHRTYLVQFFFKDKWFPLSVKNRKDAPITLVVLTFKTIVLRSYCAPQRLKVCTNTDVWQQEGRTFKSAMWSWATELLGLIKAVSISSADSFKLLPITGSKTCRHGHILFDTLPIECLYLSRYNFKGEWDYLTLRKLRTDASSHRPRSFATSDSKWDSSRTTTGSSALPSFATGRISCPGASLVARGRVPRQPVIGFGREFLERVSERDKVCAQPELPHWWREEVEGIVMRTMWVFPA